MLRLKNISDLKSIATPKTVILRFMCSLYAVDIDQLTSRRCLSRASRLSNPDGL